VERPEPRELKILEEAKKAPEAVAIDNYGRKDENEGRQFSYPAAHLRRGKP